MLEHFFPNQLTRGAVECLIAAITALAVMLLARRRAPGLLKEVPLAELRGLLQIVVVGAILAALLHGPQWTSIFVLAAMVFAAASIVRKMKAKGRRSKPPFTVRTWLGYEIPRTLSPKIGK